MNNQIFSITEHVLLENIFTKQIGRMQYEHKAMDDIYAATLRTQKKNKCF